MLERISIRNFVLIESVDIELGARLSVLTRETGAGKSILLDAVAFALGARADAGQIMAGKEEASASATFGAEPDSGAGRMLAELGIPCDGTVVVRRTLAANGKGKIFANDVQILAATAKSLGDKLIEIHGQFDNQGLLNPATHIDILDTFGGLGAARAAVGEAWRAFAEARAEREKIQAELAKAREDEEYLRYNLEELEKLDPRAGEEAELDGQRRAAMAGEKIASAVGDAAARFSAGGMAPEKLLSDAADVLARLPESAKTEQISSLIAELESAASAAANAGAELERLARGTFVDEKELDKIEERLFKIRELARKHRVAANDLPAHRAHLASLLAAINNTDEALGALEKAEKDAHEKYRARAAELSAARKIAAKKLAAEVAAELAPLKLAKATFEAKVEPAEESAKGADAVQFVGSTNAGGKIGPIHKIASGGELARFTLAIKAVILGGGEARTMIFDEVDSGISGATAAAVGERLLKLGGAVQTLVITHSPQVAACGERHFKAVKSYDAARGMTVATLSALSADERVLEVARIISGDKITDEAVAAARQLFKK